MNVSSKRKPEDCQHSEDFPVEWVDDIEWNAIQSVSSRRKPEPQRRQQSEEGVPFELVDDNEWAAIQSAFDALPKPGGQNSSPIISSTTSTSSTTTKIPSMVPSILPSSPPPAAAHHRFCHDALCPGHSPESLKHREYHCRTGISLNSGNGGYSSSSSRQLSAQESLRQKEYNFWAGISHNSSNGCGQGASSWKMGTGLLPCQFPTRDNCLGGGATTRIQCGGEHQEFHSSGSASAEERAESDSRSLGFSEHNFFPPEMVVGPGESREEPFSQLSEILLANAKVGSRESSKKQSTRRLPAWIEPAGRFLLAMEKSRSVDQRNVSGFEVVLYLETAEEKIRRLSADQLGDVASSPQQTENGHPGWIQLEQPQIGLPWGLQPSSCVDEIKPKFPAMQFRGQIVYSKTESEVNAATDELWKRVHELQETTQGTIPIGFDLEWKPSFEKGEIPRKVAVLQLCLDGRRCDVMQIIYSGIPGSLQNLLEAPSTLKVGVGIYGDASKLRQDYQISTHKIADLSIIANKKMKSLKQWSLSSLALELTGKQVEKIKSIRCGNWEALPLSEPQLQYAATDAFASLHLYQVLASFPNPKSNPSGIDDFKSEPEPPTTGIREPER